MIKRFHELEYPEGADIETQLVIYVGILCTTINNQEERIKRIEEALFTKSIPNNGFFCCKKCRSEATNILISGQCLDPACDCHCVKC